jgi:NAD(P)-dependent dehydrogenase (short-subunit alcohol dehydrogenase family)
MNRRDYDGRVVVVTGAAGGLGAALCEAFADAGARIVALDRDAQALAASVEALRARARSPRPVAIGIACDVSDEADCARAMQQARQVFGGVDVLVNNAGISHRSAFARTRPEVIRQVMAVNFFGALHCTHAALPDLVARRGQVIAISSVAGFAPLVARTGYAASKHALHGFFDSLRAELSPSGVDVLIVCPSFVATGIERHALGGDGMPVRHAQAVVGARARPEDVARRIVEAAAARRRLLLPGRVSWQAYWLSRLFPALYARIMARRVWSEMLEDG